MKKKVANIIIPFASFGLLPVAVLLWGCEEKQDTLAVAGAPVVLTADHREGTFTVYTNTSWEALPVSGEEWVLITPVSGTGETTVKVSAVEGVAAQNRTTIIRVKAGRHEQHVIVRQEAAVPELSVTPASITIGAAGEQKSVSITTNLGWTATVNPEAAWCTVSPATGTGTGALVVSATANTLEAVRSATITVAAPAEGLSTQVTVTQAAFNPNFSVTPLEINADLGGGPTQEIRVTTNLAWTASVNVGDAWCEITPLSGNGNATLSVTLDAAAASRSTEIHVEAGAYSETVTVRQLQLPAIIGTIPGLRCGAGTVVVSATADEANVVDWYDVPVGGNRLRENNSTYSAEVTSAATFYAEARNPLTGMVSASRTPVEVELLPAFSAGAIKAAGERILSGGVPVLIESINDASGGGQGTILYEWRKNGTAVADANCPNADCSEYIPKVSEAATAGVYTYVRYAQNTSCYTGWIASEGEWVMDVNQTLTTACTTMPTTAGAHYGAISITCNGSTLEVQKEDANEQQLVCWYPNNLCPPGWRWPAREEAKCLVDQQATVSNFSIVENYWTSELHSDGKAWSFSFGGAGAAFVDQNTARLVRCVR